MAFAPLGRTVIRVDLAASRLFPVTPTTDLETGVAVGRRGRLGRSRPFKYEIVLTTEVGYSGLDSIARVLVP